MASLNDKLQFGLLMKDFAGSGPASGVFSLSKDSKSAGAIINYYPRGRDGQIEFVFDPASETFAVGYPNYPSLINALSPHEKLNKLINGNYSEVIGGMFSRGLDGTIYLNDNSGHFYQNWTLEKADMLKKFLEGKTGMKVEIDFILKKPPVK